MDPIICSKNVETVVSAIKDYLGDKSKSIKDILLVETGDSQVVLLVDNEPINMHSAQIWWDGYSEGLKVALNDE